MRRPKRHGRQLVHRQHTSCIATKLPNEQETTVTVYNLFWQRQAACPQLARFLYCHQGVA